MRRVVIGERVRVSCVVNGCQYSGFAEARTLLSDFLRHELHLYGTHVGCEQGICGACTIIFDGRLARSCSTLAVQAAEMEITTIEGLANNKKLDKLRDAFSRHGGLQCGFCTPGVLISASFFLQNYKNPRDQSVRDMLSGHLCRCTGYEGMVRAIMECAKTEPEEIA